MHKSLIYFAREVEIVSDCDDITIAGSLFFVDSGCDAIFMESVASVKKQAENQKYFVHFMTWKK